MIRVLLLVFLLPTVGFTQTLVPAGRIVWSESAPAFGGISGIEVFADGRFIAISDRARFFAGQITRAGGEITAIKVTTSAAILDSKGAALKGRNADAEGLAVGPQGKIYLSFEGNHRIMHHADIQAPGAFLPPYDAIKALQNNSGLEALAVDQTGRVFAIPERSGKITRPFPVFRYDGVWQKAFDIPRRGEFLVVGADFDPKGQLYILERRFTWLGGFASRIRRFTVTNDRISAEETLLETPVGILDNMEGISVWRDMDAQLHLTIVSDDNFNGFQRTIVAEYLVSD
ncbi:MAG: esterase-like activity of phytase family protein [Paracoccaceae bacterium]